MSTPKQPDPVRGTRSRRTVRDPWSGRDLTHHTEEEIHALTESGGLLTDRHSRTSACGCGCLTEPGGLCALCGATVCPNCLRRCDHCGAPCCPAHACKVNDEREADQTLCARCLAPARRRARLRAITRLILSPFVEFRHDDE